MHIIEYKNEIRKDYRIEGETSEWLFLSANKEFYSVFKLDILRSENVISVDINLLNDIDKIEVGAKCNIKSFERDYSDEEVFSDISEIGLFYSMSDYITKFRITYNDGTFHFLDKTQKNADFIEKLFIEIL